MKVLEKATLLQRGRAEGDRGARLLPYTQAAEGVAEVFVLCGRGNDTDTDADRHRELSGMLKLVGNKLHDQVARGKVAVTGLEFTRAMPLRLMVDYYQDPEHFASAEAQSFMRDVLAPRLFKPDETKPPATTLIKRMSKVSFVTHSYGGALAHQICNLMVDTLEKKGYTPREINDICRSVVQISTASPAFMKLDTPNFTVLNFHNTRDNVQEYMLRQRQPYIEAVNLDTAQIRDNAMMDPPDGDHFACVPTKSGLAVYSRLPETMAYDKDGRTVILGKQAERPQNIMHHPIPHWYVPQPNTTETERWPGEKEEPDNSLAVKLKSQALENAVSRGPTIPDPLSLMRKGNMLTPTESASLEKEVKARQANTVAG